MCILTQWIGCVKVMHKKLKNREVVKILLRKNSTTLVLCLIVMPIVSWDELEKNSVHSTEVPLLVDCRSSASQPTAISVRLTPANGGGIVGNGSNGILKTDLAGIGLELTWKKLAGSPPVSLLPGDETVFTAVNGSEGIWDLSLLAKPILVHGEIPEMGRYTGMLQINLKYF